ncbi:retinal guanylyl cyclase 1-like, partial [Passer montanus]|uniref:retinal guanylyl cyclase 1-like n=1 Tax=Passer montanus TaxID=9160 RepID=UPI0019605C14
MGDDHGQHKLTVATSTDHGQHQTTASNPTQPNPTQPKPSTPSCPPWCHPHVPPVPRQVHPLFSTIYNSIYFLATAVEAARRSGRWVMGTSVADHARDFQLQGFCQTFTVDRDGDVSVPYVVLDTDGKGHHLWAVYGLEPGTRGLSYRSHSPHWPHSASPATDAGCWFDSGAICNGGMDAGFVFFLFLLIAALVAAGAALACHIRWVALVALVAPVSLVALVVLGDWVWLKKFPGEQHTEVKPATKLAFCKGDWVWLKKFPGEQHTEVKPATKLAFCKGDWVWLKKFPGEQHTEVKPATKLAFCK